MWKKVIIVALIIAVLCYPSLMFLPWWINMLIAFVAAYPAQLKPRQGFLAGAAGVGLCWAAICIATDLGNEHVLRDRMAQLFGLPWPWLITSITIIVGSITGGLGAWAAALIAAKKAPVATP
jgi:hypothetical protein